MRMFLTAFAAALLAAAAASAQTTTITASHIAQDLTGVLLGSGQLCLTPVGLTGAPSAFQANGKQYMPQQTCTAVTSGAISGLAVPDVVAISPPGVGYKIAIEDQQGNIITSYAQPIFPTGTTWSLDTWSPTQTVTVNNPTTVGSGPNPPQGRCGTNPAIYYTATATYTCFDQVWILQTSNSGSLTSAAITTALTFVPVTPTQLANAIAAAWASVPPPTASQITTALNYTPANVTALANYCLLSGCTLSGQVVLPFDPTVAAQAATKHYVDTAIAAAIAPTGPSSPTATPTFSPVGGTYTAAQTVVINETTAFATVSYCANPAAACTPNLAYSTPIAVGSTETICVNALAGSGGVVSATSCSTYIINAGGTTPTGTGIGTIIAQGYLTDGSVAYKTCSAYPGAVCSGGVGTTVPSSNPTHAFGLNTPSANTGLANKVGNFHLETATPAGAFTEALWTTTGGGIGVNASATNFYVSGYFKVNYAAGQSRIEFDPYAFDTNLDWMFGTQCNHDNNLIQTANQSSSWTSTTAQCAKLYDGNYHHVEMTMHRTLAADTSCSGKPCEYWDAIGIDGTWTALNVTMPATVATGWAGSGWQWQIDGSPTAASSGTPAKYDLWVDSAQFIAGLAATGGGSPGGAGGSTTGTGDLDSFNFDSGTSTPAGLTPVGSPVVVATQEHSSPNSAHFPSGLNYYTDTINPTNTLYTRQYVYLNTVNGSLSDSFLRFYHGTTELFVYFFDTPSQHLTYFDQATGASVTAYATTFPTSGWHYIETYTKIDPTAGHVTVKIDGTQVYDLGSLNTGTLSVNTVWFGNIGATAPTGWDTYEDNVDFADNGFIGPI